MSAHHSMGKNLNWVPLIMYVGPAYERKRTRYYIDTILCASKGAQLSVPRGSELELLAAKRPCRDKKFGKHDLRGSLYPSDDVLGRQRCSGMSAVLTENEKKYLDERESFVIRQDASGELFNLFSLHEVKHALAEDEKKNLLFRTSLSSSQAQRQGLKDAREAIYHGIDEGIERGTLYKILLYQTS